LKRRKTRGSYSEIKQKKSMDKKSKKQETKASKAVDKFIKKINTNLKLASGKKSPGSLNKQKDFLFKSKAIFKKDGKGNSVHKKKKTNENLKKIMMPKKKTLDFEKILNNFSLYSKVNERGVDINDISLSTINHSGFKPFKYNGKKVSDKSSMTETSSKTPQNFQKISKVLSYTCQKQNLNKTRVVVNADCSFVYSCNASKIENDVTKKNIPYLEMPRDKKTKKNLVLNKENASSQNDESLESMRKFDESSPRQVHSMVNKMYKKIKFFEKKNGNLERQLRNRNKDYLYALKEIEMIKLKLN
jgi:hypothetical protein